jgi:hypothetical protein
MLVGVGNHIPREIWFGGRLLIWLEAGKLCLGFKHYGSSDVGLNFNDTYIDLVAEVALDQYSLQSFPILKAHKWLDVMIFEDIDPDAMSLDSVQNFIASVM